MVYSQNISGHWIQFVKGKIIDKHELVLKTDDTIAYTGISHDKAGNTQCYHYCKGLFNMKERSIKLTDGKGYKVSLGHIPSIYKLKYKKENGEEFLYGKIYAKGIGGKLLSLGEEINVTYIKVKKYSVSQFEQLEKKFNYLKTYLSQKKHSDSIKQVVKDSLIERINANQNEINENIINDKIEAINNRENKVLKEIKSNKDMVTISVEDYGIEDNDRITILLNDLIVKYNIEITKKPLEILIPLNTDLNKNIIYVVAENVGKSPPNTANITIKIGNKIYKSRCLTDKKRNTSIIIKSH